MLKAKEIASQLAQDTESFRVDLDTIADSVRKSLKLACHDYRTAQDANDAILRDLTRSESVLRDAVIESNRLADIERIEYCKSRSVTNRLEAKKKSLPQEVQSEKKLYAERIQKRDERTDELMNIVQLQKNKQKTLQAAADYFSGGLGMDYEVLKVDDNSKRLGLDQQLKVTMFGLGREFHDKASFTLLLDNGKYMVGDCLPDIELLDLVQTLNDTDDLAGFVKRIRKEWQRHFYSK